MIRTHETTAGITDHGIAENEPGRALHATILLYPCSGSLERFLANWLRLPYGLRTVNHRADQGIDLSRPTPRLKAST